MGIVPIQAFHLFAINQRGKALALVRKRFTVPVQKYPCLFEQLKLAVSLHNIGDQISDQRWKHAGAHDSTVFTERILDAHSLAPVV